MAHTKQVRTKQGQEIWVEFEDGHIDDKGIWRVIDVGLLEYELGDGIYPDELDDREKFTVLEQDFEAEDREDGATELASGWLMYDDGVRVSPEGDVYGPEEKEE